MVDGGGAAKQLQVKHSKSGAYMREELKIFFQGLRDDPIDMFLFIVILVGIGIVTHFCIYELPGMLSGL